MPETAIIGTGPRHFKVLFPVNQHRAQAAKLRQRIVKNIFAKKGGGMNSYKVQPDGHDWSKS